MRRIGLMRDTFETVGLKNIVEEEVSSLMTHPTPEQYWDFMTDIAAPVVAGLSKVDTATRAKIREEVLASARAAAQEGQVRLLSTATIIVGTR
jgi:hypothetical protein